jgi:phenylpyruvate tautomerase PptA (4-oxalocrotonate tautomerase family)
VPMLDVYIPDGALRPDAEKALINRLTEILIRGEGADPTNLEVRAVSWVFLHRPEAVFVGGEPADAPRYKVVATVPEGQLDERARATVVAEATEAVLDAEQGQWPRDKARVWVFPLEIPDGQWGGRGRIVHLADILIRITDSPEDAHALAAKRIAASRTERAVIPS